MIAAQADFELCWLRLAKALDREFQRPVSRFATEHATHCIALLRPHMQQRFAVLAGNGIARGVEIEDNPVIFEHHGIPRAIQELLKRARQGWSIERHGEREYSRNFEV